MKKKVIIPFLFGLIVLTMFSCTSNDDSKTIDPGEYVVFAWNDLGMHCLNPTYDKMVILPPYNNVYAQVIRRGAPPEIVTQGITVEYKLTNNSYSYGKRQYSGFWDYCTSLFNTTLMHDKGLKNMGLFGEMQVQSDHFIAEGIPVTPVDDDNKYNPYQIAEITVMDATGKIIAQTQATVPVSDEINCTKCHGANAFENILQIHDDEEGTSLASSTPILCARCHGSPALGTDGPGSSGKYLSQAIHGYHSTKNASCYDCHPGATAKCNRSIEHTNSEGKCTVCHGTMSQVAQSIASGRIPWASEPKCATCHSDVAQVETGSTLYRNAKAHGNIYCSACHGSPHAMVPSSQSSDNYQSMQYQLGESKTMGSCGICHRDSRGEADDISEFVEMHGGTSPRKRIGCHVCHTKISTTTTSWPHAYQWTNSNK